MFVPQMFSLPPPFPNEAKSRQTQFFEVKPKKVLERSQLFHFTWTICPFSPRISVFISPGNDKFYRLLYHKLIRCMIRFICDAYSRK